MMKRVDTTTLSFEFRLAKNLHPNTRRKLESLTLGHDGVMLDWLHACLNLLCFIARNRKGKIVGWAAGRVEQNRDRGTGRFQAGQEIDLDVYVDRDLRGHGYATQILAYATLVLQKHRYYRKARVEYPRCSLETYACELASHLELR